MAQLQGLDNLRDLDLLEAAEVLCLSPVWQLYKQELHRCLEAARRRCEQSKDLVDIHQAQGEVKALGFSIDVLERKISEARKRK